jgi:hypothetical protein
VSGERNHDACIDAWLKRSAKGLTSDALVELFEAAFGALWTRTVITLGDVTLTAIADRVLFSAAEKFAPFSSLTIDPKSGIQTRGLRERADSMQNSDLVKGIRFVLVELLTVLGNLTAEILTPELHAELSRVALPKKSARRAAVNPKNTVGEDKSHD